MVDIAVSIDVNPGFIRRGSRSGDMATLTPRRVINEPIVLYGDPTQVPADLHDVITPGGACFGDSMTESFIKANLASGNWSSVSGSQPVSPATAKGMIMSPSADSSSVPPASYANLVRNLSLHGGAVAGGSYQMNMQLHVNHASDPHLCNGVNIAGRRTIIDRLNCNNIRGYMVVMRPHEPQTGDTIVDVLRTISNIHGQRCWGGIFVEVGASDTNIYRPEISGVRDYCVWMQSGNGRLEGGHVYGAGLAAVRIGGHANSGPCQIIGTDCSDATYGVLNEVAGSWLRGMYSQGGTTACLQANAKLRIDGSWAHVKHANAKGVVFEANTQGSYMHGGGVSIQSAGPPSGVTCIHVKSHGVSVNGVTLDGGGASGANGLVLDSAVLTGSRFTIDFANGFPGAGSDGFAVRINQMGAGNEIRVNGLAGEVNNLVKVGAGWTGRIVRNGVDLTPGTAYP